MPYSTDALSGRRVLVAEDEYLLADTIVAAIQSAGGEVIGPYASVSAGLAALVTADPQPDAATLNVRLMDGESYPIADELIRRGIPFVFASANSAASLPPRFSRCALVGKPYAAYQVVRAVAAVLGVDDDAD